MLLKAPDLASQSAASRGYPNVLELAQLTLQSRCAANNLDVHCQPGIGRSSLGLRSRRRCGLAPTPRGSPCRRNSRRSSGTRMRWSLAYAAATVAGFLLTAIPNWTGRMPLQGGPLAMLVLLWVIGRVGVLLSAEIGAPAAAVADLCFPAVFLAVVAREISLEGTGATCRCSAR